MQNNAPWSDATILAARPPKNSVDPRRPYAYLVEPECAANGEIEDVATIFLTNRECPFRCLMCDLWQNTTDQRVPVGAIPEQINFALSMLPPARHVKLYNSGNFFDRQAIPADDYLAIAQCVAPFESVIVENHPKLCGDDCLRFRDLLDGNLEIALGLETIHPEVLPRLNKQMTADDFQRAVRLLSDSGIATRAFILLRPPFLDEAAGVEWAIRSIEFAFDAGVQCCSVIPTRDGNGAMERLKLAGSFQPPTIRSLETVLAAGLAMQRGRVFVDLWDADRFFDCAQCGPARRDRLSRMNLEQRLLPAVLCNCEACR